MAHKGPLPPLPLFITTEQAKESMAALGVPPASVCSVLVRNGCVEVMRYRRDGMGRAVSADGWLATETTVIPVIDAATAAFYNERLTMGV